MADEYKPELRELTPADMQCIVGSCPRIYEEIENRYLIIGTKVDPVLVGLEGKVNENEALISVPKELIDNKQK